MKQKKVDSKCLESTFFTYLLTYECTLSIHQSNQMCGIQSIGVMLLHLNVLGCLSLFLWSQLRNLDLKYAIGYLG